MTKGEIDLTSYLPPFMSEYKELNLALNAENPEFELVWDGAERVLRNEFIATADEYGIARLEKMAGLTPTEDDTLETRRSRVMNKWLSKLPYTVKMLIKNLGVLCGGEDFSISKDFDKYTIRITTHLRLYNQVRDLQELLGNMIPANMIIESFNSVMISSEGKAAVFAGIRGSGIHKKRKVEIKNYGLE